VRLYSRSGNDLTWRFPLIVETVARLRARSFIIDGEAVACGKDGLASFDRLRYRHDDANAFMYAFDLIEFDGDDLRREPLEVRKTTLARAGQGIRFNEHITCDVGDMVFHHACRMGLEGIVSKRKDSLYRSGRSPDWLKMKNPDCAFRFVDARLIPQPGFPQSFKKALTISRIGIDSVVCYMRTR
jgi:bifunctional non-homologous end joining protein LigD